MLTVIMETPIRGGGLPDVMAAQMRVSDEYYKSGPGVTGGNSPATTPVDKALDWAAEQGGGHYQQNIAEDILGLVIGSAKLASIIGNVLSYDTAIGSDPVRCDFPIPLSEYEKAVNNLENASRHYSWNMFWWNKYGRQYGWIQPR